jgi:8-oxo-dGTP diphosphatase
MKNNPCTTVAAIIVSKSLDILLTKRKILPFKDQWCLPGGHIDLNETSRDAVKREVKEETGLEFKCTFFKYFDEIFPDLKIHNVVLAYYGQCSGDVVIQESEISEFGWFTFSQINDMKLAFAHNEIVCQYCDFLEYRLS